MRPRFFLRYWIVIRYGAVINLDAFIAVIVIKILIAIVNAGAEAAIKRIDSGSLKIKMTEITFAMM